MNRRKFLVASMAGVGAVALAGFSEVEHIAVSVWDDHGRPGNYYFAEVFLDGERLLRCLEANTERGTALQRFSDLRLVHRRGNVVVRTYDKQGHLLGQYPRST